ncbi:cyclin-dependent kinase inhibitor [Salix suchowensis]|nr:cyclin-dependent kinase inhibitor [Salix suchowensis]
MVKAAAAAAQVGVTSSRGSAKTSRRRSRHIKISIEVRSNLTNHRHRRHQNVIIRSANSVLYKPDVNSGDRTVAEERCSTSSPELEEDDDDDALMSASCCSSNGSCDDRIKFADLEEGRVEVETSMYYSSRSGERETTPTSSDRGEESTSEDMDSTANPPLKKPSSHQGSTPAAGLIRITDEEFEKFFGEIQKNVPQCFKDKYNFDFDEDEPLEGRYEWARLKP